MIMPQTDSHGEVTIVKSREVCQR